MRIVKSFLCQQYRKDTFSCYLHLSLVCSQIFHDAPEDCVDLCNVRVLPKHNQAMSNHRGNTSPRSPAAVMSASSNPVLTQDSGGGGGGGGIGGVGGGSTGGTPSHIYANQAPVHPSRTSRFIRPTQVFNHQTGGKSASF